jgi:hypothetical protein
MGEFTFVSAVGQSVTDYASSSVDILSSLDESDTELAQPVGVALRDGRTVTLVTVEMGEGIPY